MAVENQLTNLIKANGSLEFPGLGVFTIVYQPAKIDFIQNKISPPGKFISFQSNNSSFDAQNQIDINLNKDLEWSNYFKDIYSKLAKKETVVLPGLGSIYQDFRNEVHFIPSQQNYDENTFGLNVIPAKTVSRKTKVDHLFEKKKPIIVKKKGISNILSELAFSILIALSLLTVGFGFWYAINTKKIVQTPTRFQIAESTLESQRKLEDILDYDAKWSTPGYFDLDSLQSANDANRFKLSKSDKKASEIAAAKEIKNLIAIEKSKKTYKIAVGSFSNESNAKILLKKISKMQLTAVNEHTKTNMTRIIIIKHADEAELKDLMSKIKSSINTKAYVIR
jgi:hypothetical protein